MKQFLLPAVLSTLVFAACNDSGSNTSASSADSSNMNMQEQPKADAVMSKTGLPMSSSQEVPANTSTGNGSMDVSYNKDNHLLKYTVTWSGLTDKPTMAHIHGPAAKGVNAGVRQDLTGVLVKETSGSFSDSVLVDGNAIKEDSLLNGFYYINIHTPKNPGGEIRGQIEF